MRGWGAEREYKRSGHGLTGGSAARKAMTKTTTGLGEAAAQAARSETGNGVRNIENEYNQIQNTDLKYGTNVQ